VKKRIALMGVSGAGKDYLASYLIKNHGVARFSFSDQLKRLAQLIYPWLELDYLPIIKEKNLDIQLSTGERITKSLREILFLKSACPCSWA
jgi:dephospho-CoA kinase